MDHVHHLAAADLVLGAANFTHGHDLLHHHAFGPPVPEAEAPPKRRRQRRPTLASALREAAKAGVPVRSAQVEAGKVTLTFGEVEPTDESNPWLAEIDRAVKQ
jgi:hypothetical protein